MNRKESLKEINFLKRKFPTVWESLRGLPPSKRARKTHFQYCFYKNPLRDGLKISEVSKRLHVPRRTIQHWVRNLKIKTMNQSPYRIAESEFENIKAAYEKIADARKGIKELTARGLKRNSAYVYRSREKSKGKEQGKV